MATSMSFGDSLELALKDLNKRTRPGTILCSLTLVYFSSPHESVMKLRAPLCIPDLLGLLLQRSPTNSAGGAL